MDDALLAGIDAAASVAVATRAMGGLAPMPRACFELVALRDVPIAEVAAMHAISESTVRQHVFRARAALRALCSATSAIEAGKERIHERINEMNDVART